MSDVTRRIQIETIAQDDAASRSMVVQADGVTDMPESSHKQTFDYSCGAASLMCAAAELGITEYPAKLNRANFSCGFSASSMVETMLFEQVGAGDPGTSAEKRGYSLPSKLANAGKALGMEATVYLPRNLTSSLLTLKYDQEVEAVKKLGVWIERSVTPAPENMHKSQRALVLVSSGIIALHWVMMRPDGSYMDPGDGESHPNFAAMNFASATKLYIPLSIGIVFERGDNLV